MEERALQTHSSVWISRLIWAVNLCSISASTLCYIYLSWYIYHATGNIILSQAVLYAPMILPVIFVNQVQGIAEKTSPRKLLMMSNLVAAICTLIIFSLIHRIPTFALLGGLLIGSIDALQRVGRIVAIKYYFSGDKIETTVPLTLTAQFIAGGLAGMLMGSIKGEMSPQLAMSMISVLFIASVLASFLLPKLNLHQEGKAQARSLKSFAALLSDNAPLKKAFLNFIVFITFFQGFFNVSRVTLPSHVLNLPENFVGYLQLVNSGAALVGAVFYFIYNRKGVKFNPLYMAIISALFMVITSLGVNVLTSYLSYFFYIFFFELAFFKLQADIVLKSNVKDMPMIAAMQYAGVYIGMITSIFIGSVLTQYSHLYVVAIFFTIAYFLCYVSLSKERK
ncbi:MULTISPECIES: hypothetical protein [Dickeya]|uniref:MFS transporter n=1 Tax=Dickeya zeae (strain Ech586) TaxID=590409 RepID=D2BYM2_DICZ5|nr:MULTISPECIES: hypothetical protein [Dickeya]ACZ76690.1 conserved hypothetical protein [Dickeya parazeae Ech586]MCA6987101.1 hypothetical protein [Dickeya zeae]